MTHVVFVPGILGSVLETPEHEIVWPPRPIEILTGYGRTQTLLREDLVVGDVIREVSCVDVYKPILGTLTAMGFKESGTGDRLHVFPYDWRRDLEELAGSLATKLEEVAADAGPIVVVAHSMGGLVARLMLETGRFDAKPWFSRIDRLVTIGTPHLGAPLALARVLGLDSAMGVSAADFRQLAADPRYPSGYQLLPAPGEAACWDTKVGSGLRELDIYDDAVATQLGLNPVLVARAAWLHDALSAGKVPDHVRYFYFAGCGHQTATRVNVGAAGMVVTRTDDAGDGTVPLWSALPVSAQKQLVVGEHARFFAEENFEAVLYALFGKAFPRPPVGMAAGGVAALSVQALSIRQDEEIELVIAFARPVTSVKAEIVLECSEGPGKPFGASGKNREISFSGPPTPTLTLRLPATFKPGFYRLQLVGRPSSRKPVRFAVSAS